MKQTKFILFLPVIELLGVIVPQENIHHLANYIYLELYLICVCGYLGMKKSMFLLLSIWSAWLLITSGSNAIQEYAQLEGGVVAALVYWIYRRPEWIPSEPPSENTIQIAFYYGDKSPFIAKIMALLGLNVRGIAVIIGDSAMVPVGKSGKIEKRPREALRKWIKLDSGIIIHKSSLCLFSDLEGNAVGNVGCMVAMKSILVLLGYWSPLDTPSSLMSKMLAWRK